MRTPYQKLLITGLSVLATAACAVGVAAKEQPIDGAHNRIGADLD